jgi:hypothetical protein
MMLYEQLLAQKAVRSVDGTTARTQRSTQLVACLMAALVCKQIVRIEKQKKQAIEQKSAQSRQVQVLLVVMVNLCDRKCR